MAVLVAVLVQGYIAALRRWVLTTWLQCTARHLITKLKETEGGATLRRLPAATLAIAIAERRTGIQVITSPGATL